MNSVAPAGGNTGIAVAANGLTKLFNDEAAVQNLSFTIPTGGIFGFIGPSGCGKTTTIRLLTGIYKPTSGEASVLGDNPQHFSRRTRSRIGYMPQLFVLYPDLSVWENLNFSASIYGMSLRGRKKILTGLLDFVGLTEHRKKLARHISGGMQRRLALASALVHDPELIFMDEPTAGVDPVLRTRFWEKFREMRSSGDTLFVTTQYVGEAAYCDYVGVMNSGNLIMVDTPLGLRKKALGGDAIDLQASTQIDYALIKALASLPFVRGAPVFTGPNSIRIVVDEASTALPQLLEWCSANRVDVESAKEYTPPFDDIFVILLQKEGVVA
jgi:ABC-2 type transport system ATP-binding protein